MRAVEKKEREDDMEERSGQPRQDDDLPLGTPRHLTVLARCGVALLAFAGLAALLLAPFAC